MIQDQGWECPHCGSTDRTQLISRFAGQPASNRPSFNEDRAIETARLGAQWHEPNFPHWKPELAAMGVTVSAHEMCQAGVAVDAAASEWTPCRSDADKQREYAEEASLKALTEEIAVVNALPAEVQRDPVKLEQALTEAAA